MKKSTRQNSSRLLALLGLAATLFVVFSKAGDYASAIDVRAALLVFAAPVLLLAIFGKRELGIGVALDRLSQLRRQGTSELTEELARNTAQARGQYGYSHLAKFAEKHEDSMVRYAGTLFSARFRGEELTQLLSQKIQAEDAQWKAISSAVAYLTRMAPYFGMLATVIGMIKLLENMSDFTRISGSMALAMQGTLYGLLSFTILYSPLQRFVGECREEISKRNETIARWFILVSSQADASFIETDLSSTRGEAESLSATAGVERGHS